MHDEVFTILEGMRGTEPTVAEVQAAADRIAALGDAVMPALIEALADEDEAVLAVAAGALRRLPGPVPTQPLMGLLRSSRIGDVAKALLLGILEDAGMDIHDPSLVGAVVDLDSLLMAEAGGNGRHAPAAEGLASVAGTDASEAEP